MGFSRQEYWSGLPCPLLGDLPDPGIERVSASYVSCIGRQVFTASDTWEALWICPVNKEHCQTLWLTGLASDM